MDCVQYILEMEMEITRPSISTRRKTFNWIQHQKRNSKLKFTRRIISWSSNSSCFTGAGWYDFRHRCIGTNRINFIEIIKPGCDTSKMTWLFVTIQYLLRIINKFALPIKVFQLRMRRLQSAVLDWMFHFLFFKLVKDISFVHSYTNEHN